MTGAPRLPQQGYRVNASAFEPYDNTGEGIRTPNLLIRSQVLYPIELRPLYAAGEGIRLVIAQQQSFLIIVILSMFGAFFAGEAGRQTLVDPAGLTPTMKSRYWSVPPVVCPRRPNGQSDCPALAFALERLSIHGSLGLRTQTHPPK